MNDRIKIRRAQAGHEDAWLIARCVMMGVGYELDSLDSDKQADLVKLEQLCMRDDTLYSWRNAFVAEMDGERAGAMVAYDGAGYRQMRAVSFARLSFFRGQNIEAMPVETCPGEYYFDTLAVLPPFRGHGIARAVFSHVIAQKPHGLAGTLLVDPDNPPALRLYHSLGFRPEGEIFAFGMLYTRMVLNAL